MRRILIGVSVLVVSLLVIAAAFAGGVVIGRWSRPAISPPVAEEAGRTPVLTPTATPHTESPGDPEATQDSLPTPETESERPPLLGAAEFDYELLTTVLELLDEQFYGALPDGKTLSYGAIRGMLMTLDDPYTSFIEPSISAILNEDATGEFEGIGAMVTMREDGYLEIASLIPGQPAEAAGVRPNDIILSVNGQSIVGLGLYEAISYIRGPAGTEARLEIIRPGEPDPLFISVTRARIEIPIVEARMLDNNIAYLSLSEFDARASDRVEEALRELLAQNPRGLIFDLRGNPGGWLNQAIRVADIFLDQGIVAIERDNTGREQRFPSRSGDIGESIPLVVLVNRGSASASEIVAGAIQDRGRGILIGTQTLGKGSVQRPNDLQDGSQLRITIARWYTPNEQALHGEGLTPDIEVTIPSDTPAGEDPQLERAIQYFLQGE